MTTLGSAIAATCVGYSQNLNVPNFTTGDYLHRPNLLIVAEIIHFLRASICWLRY